MTQATIAASPLDVTVRGGDESWRFARAAQSKANGRIVALQCMTCGQRLEVANRCHEKEFDDAEN